MLSQLYQAYTRRMRDPDAVLVRHHQLFPTSPVTSLIELMLKLMRAPAPNLQSLEKVLPLGWASFVNQSFGGATLRRVDWDRVLFKHLLEVELRAGRPIGILLTETINGAVTGIQRAWAVIRFTEVRPYVFADLVGKNPETGGGEGRFSEKRMIRLDEIPDQAVDAIIYFEVPS
jgi:hypothetical protein